MTITPDQLREKGNRWRELGQYDLANIYNQHAAALEEIERLKKEGYAAGFNAGREAGLREAAAIVGTLAERPYDSMPEFDAILHAESAVLSAI